MGLFFSSKSKSKSNEGLIADNIECLCDVKDYLLWKWRPEGASGVNSTKRENEIRYGSMLKVRPSEAAIFFYRQKDGTEQDFIKGPYHGKIETANFPILSSIAGAAFGGSSPFQAEIYFINLQENNQFEFFVPNFKVFQLNVGNRGLPVSVKGRITFYINDYQEFIKKHELRNITTLEFREKVQTAINSAIAGEVQEGVKSYNIPALQVDTLRYKLTEPIAEKIKTAFHNDFGVELLRLDLDEFVIDTASQEYLKFAQITEDIESNTIKDDYNIIRKNKIDTQAINAENVAESARIQREELQRAQKLQTESNYLGAHSLNLQSEVLKTGAENLGQMGTMNLGNGGGGFNPAGMMTGMMMGGAMGGQMANMMNQMGGQMQQTMNTPPPLPTSQYYVAINGQQCGPFTIPQLQQYAAQGEFTATSLVWKQGMTGWAAASTVDELSPLFATMTPPPLPPTM
ncbi:MAG: SPFH domain-containing protein [Bacteroidaceae bacterium]|nr:SPFH domain-containing protein [Bacteroidaceae bacterium]